MSKTQEIDKLSTQEAPFPLAREQDYKELPSYDGFMILGTSTHVVEVKNLQSVFYLCGIHNSRDIDYDAELEDAIITRKHVNTSAFFFTDTVLEQLKRDYTLIEPTQVELFINEYKFLVGPLAQIYTKIGDVFEGHVSDVCLALDVDPEEDFTGLSVVIKTPLTHDLSLKLLDEFDEWWLDQDDDVRVLVTVMVRKE